MSKCSFAIYKVARGWIIAFVLALAFLQVPQANAIGGCQSGDDCDKCSSNSLKITGFLGVGTVLLPPGIDVEVTPFVVLPCGVTRYGEPQHLSLINIGHRYFTLNPVQSSFSDSPGKYIGGVTITSVSNLEGLTLSLSHLVTSSLDKPLVMISGLDHEIMLNPESLDFQLINPFIYPCFPH